MATEDKTNARIAELETQLAFQDDLLQSLNKVLIRQEGQIEQLILELKSLREQVVAMSADAGKSNSDEPPPPHY